MADIVSLGTAEHRQVIIAGMFAFNQVICRCVTLLHGERNGAIFVQNTQHMSRGHSEKTDLDIHLSILEKKTFMQILPENLFLLEA